VKRDQSFLPHARAMDPFWSATDVLMSTRRQSISINRERQHVEGIHLHEGQSQRPENFRLGLVHNFRAFSKGEPEQRRAKESCELQ
jgi:hypothetical protein